MNSVKPRAPFQVLVMSEESRLGREAIETAYAPSPKATIGLRPKLSESRPHEGLANTQSKAENENIQPTVESPRCNWRTSGGATESSIELPAPITSMHVHSSRNWRLRPMGAFGAAGGAASGSGAGESAMGATVLRPLEPRAKTLTSGKPLKSVEIRRQPKGRVKRARS